MTWDDSPEKRNRDNASYDAAYRRNREVARRRAGGTCEGCGHKHPRLECDHIVGKAVTGRADNSPGNLQMLCSGPGTCRCHDRKTMGEGGGWRRPRGATDPAPRPRTDWNRE